MDREPMEDTLPDLPAAVPSPELRERVLGRCRQEMARRRAARDRARKLRWSLAAGILCLMLLNAAEEQRNSTRIAAIVTQRAPMAKAPAAAPTMIGSLRARATLLAALLRDPNAL
jgi:hypothetical protein